MICAKEKNKAEKDDRESSRKERVTVSTQPIKGRTGFEPGSESGTSAVLGFPVVS